MITQSRSVAVYKIRSRYFLIRDTAYDNERAIDFHVKTGDCFPTIATIAGLLEDSLIESREKGQPPADYVITVLEQLRKNLMYLDKNYKIVPEE